MQIHDTHTRLMRWLLWRGLAVYEPIATVDVPAPARPAEPDLELQTHPGVGPRGLEVPVDDEDGEQRPFVFQWLLSTANRVLPVSDPHRPWPGGDAPDALLRSTFAPYLPTPHVTWPDLDDPAAMATFLLSGLGAHRLERAEEDGISGVALRLSSLSSLPVRPGFLRYGGDAFVDDEGVLRWIAVDGQRFAPDHADFAQVAFRFRSSLLLAVTVIDHLGTTHFGVSNAALVATRRQLDAAHPLRIFLRPFQYRTGAINDNGFSSLLPDGAMVHRATGLTAQGMAMARRTMLDQAAFLPFEQDLRQRGVHPDQLPPALSRRMPWGHDGLLFHAAVRGFVEDVRRSSPALSGLLEGPAAPATRAWWQDFSERLAEPLPPLSDDSLDDVLTWLLMTVTAVHAHVGHVVPLTGQPDLIGGRLRPGERRCDPDNATTLCTLTALTGLAVPGIDGDLKPSMPDPEAAEAAGRFRAALAKVQQEIDHRNQGRSPAFVAFSPRKVPCSVSR